MSLVSEVPELTAHTIARVANKLSGATRSTETWEFVVEGVDTRVQRLIASGTGDDHDELVVTGTSHSPTLPGDAWSSDPDFPFHPEQSRVLRALPDVVCDTIEELTGLDMKEARE